MLSSEQIQARLHRILPTVQKPGRYTGGELNQIVKPWSSVATRLALVFPELYDVGMSNLGIAVLYDQINRRPDALAERAFAPWGDMEQALRQAEIPLYSLESKHALSAFDIIGFSIPYEMLYTNVLNCLDLAQIPLFSTERGPEHPLVIAGGLSTYNPEPMHAFMDAFVIGEGEEIIHEIIQLHQASKAAGQNRLELLQQLAQIPGVYVPSFYEVHYDRQGNFTGLEKTQPGAPLPIFKRIVAELPPPPTQFIVPYIETVHNRIPIEIMRGCTRGCRFCHSGFVSRPVRERPVEQIAHAVDEAVRATGYEEVGLLSLSSSDYTQIVELVEAVSQRSKQRHIGISLPSLRIETVSVDLMDGLMESRRTGFTLAPEAATENMRKIINKPVSTGQLLEVAHEIYSRGWTTIKLYFMIGHPSETEEDVQEIAHLCNQVLEVGRKAIGRRAKVHAGVSTFIPKPHTPFQWAACDTEERMRDKQAILRRRLSGDGLKMTWNRPEETLLEAWLSRGDRRTSQVIFTAWQLGAKFEAWHEYFRPDAWLQAFAQAGLDPYAYSHRPRGLQDALPWEHISTGVHKNFLQEEFLASQRGETREDCRTQCYACGILPIFKEIRRAHPGRAWKCPEVPAAPACAIPPHRTSHAPETAICENRRHALYRPPGRIPHP